MADTPSVLSPGVVVGGTYEVDRLLGKGGMGEVWLARHLRLPGKQVAVKVLRLGGASSTTEVLARFKREAEIAARLAHPNIVQVLDYNTLPSGDPYLVMELLQGDSLAARLREGPMAPGVLRQLMKQVGAALEAAHALGVVHRDLKPENIFLVPTSLGDQVKVLDFGISKVADSNTVQTTDSVLVGTPLYMSPEQALGNNSEVSARSDVFSLGSICYELLCGEAPFFAESIAKVVFRIAYEPHRPLSERVADLPPGMVAAIDHALVKDREHRTPGVRAFIEELTGEPMPLQSREAVADTTSGVFTPGMKVSESLAGGDTVSPSQAGRKLATPAPRTPAPVAPAPVAPPPAAAPPTPAPRRGAPMGLGVGLAVLVVVAGGAALVVWQRAGSTATGLPAADAGAQVVVSPPKVEDAGAAPEVVVAQVEDAGVVKAPAGPVREPEPEREEPLPPEDRQVVEALRGQLVGADMDSVNRRANAAFAVVKSKAGQRAVLLAQLRVSCRLRDLGTINAVRARLAEDHPRALRRAKTLCRQEMGAASPF